MSKTTATAAKTAQAKKADAPTDEHKLSRQAAYQARRRQQQKPLTFFAPDREALDAAVTASGLTQQEWLAEAVTEKIARAGAR